MQGSLVPGLGGPYGAAGIEQGARAVCVHCFSGTCQSATLRSHDFWSVPTWRVREVVGELRLHVQCPGLALLWLEHCRGHAVTPKRS